MGDIATTSGDRDPFEGLVAGPALGAIGERLPAEVVGQRRLREVLRDVVGAARRRVPSAVEASITVISDGAVVPVEFDGAAAVALDERQYEHEVGPCLDVAARYRPVRLDSLAPGSTAAQLYPAFSHAARRAGIDACLAVPLGPLDLRPAAALNLYATTAFTLEEQQKAEAFCMRVTVLVLNAARWNDLHTLVGQLQEALTGRAVIEQAKGMLMLHHGWSADEAFADLRARSSHGHQKLRDVAAHTIAGLLASRPPPPPAHTTTSASASASAVSGHDEE